VAGGLAIRPAEPRDRDRVIALWLALIDHHRRLDRDYPALPQIRSALDREVDQALAGSACRIYVADAGDGPIGFVSAEIADEIGTPGALGTIHELYVAPERRGTGVGRALVGAAEEWFRARSVARRRVRVETANAAALRFWRAAGYAEDAASSTAAEPRARILLRQL
jgi:GNAT superfamily N-acetyltransferase